MPRAGPAAPWGPAGRRCCGRRTAGGCASGGRAPGSTARHLATLSPVLRLSAGFDVSSDDRLAWVQHRPGRQELWLATLAR